MCSTTCPELPHLRFIVTCKLGCMLISHVSEDDGMHFYVPWAGTSVLKGLNNLTLGLVPNEWSKCGDRHVDPGGVNDQHFAVHTKRAIAFSCEEAIAYVDPGGSVVQHFAVHMKMQSPMSIPWGWSLGGVETVCSPTISVRNTGLHLVTER